MKSKRTYKNFIIPVVLTILFLGIIGVWASSVITDSKNQVSKTVINDSGMYYNDGSTYRGVSSGTADVVVCRGTNAFDDIYKSVKWASGCDVVCKSTGSDCTTELQSCYGNNCYIRKGIYDTSKLTLPAKTVLFGEGTNSTILRNNDNTNDHVIAIGSGGSDVIIRDLKIDGNRANENAGAGIYIYGDVVTFNPKRVVLDNLWITDCNDQGIYAKYTWLTRMNNIYLDYNGIDGYSGGLYLDTIADTIFLSNIYADNNGMGYWFTDSFLINGVNLEGNNNLYHGFYMNNVKWSLFNNIRSVNNGLYANLTYSGIFLNGVSERNIFTNVGSYNEVGTSNCTAYSINEASTSDFNLFNNVYVGNNALPTYSNIWFNINGNNSMIRNTLGSEVYNLCNFGTKGNTRYLNSINKMQYCNTTDWVNIG